MIQFDSVTASVRKTWPARCTATLQTHKASLKTTFSLFEKRKLSKTKPRYGGPVARNVCRTDWETMVLRIAPLAAPFLRAEVSSRSGAHGQDMWLCRCRKVACATNWHPTRKLAKHTKRLAKHGGNLPNQKCCFPNMKRLIFIIGAPALVIAKSSRLLAGKVTCLHSGTGCIKAKFSEMSAFQLGK